MPTLRFIVGVAIGMALYHAGVLILGGVLAARAIPVAYFAFFGKQNQGLGLLLLNVGTWSLPVMAFIALGAYAALTVLRRSWLSTSVGIAVGMFVLFFYWCLIPPASIVVPWWSVPNLIAPWLGLALAVWFTARRFAQTNSSSG